MTEGDEPPSFVLVHADESCLGNQFDGDNPGGAGALIEARLPEGGVGRWDLWVSSPATTNNRMALRGAIEVCRHLFRQDRSVEIHYYSDSKYLVEGITSWLPAWKRRGWRRRGGPIENLDLWQALDETVETRPVTFHWVRGHAGHPKNEYADHLAVGAARRQDQSGGLTVSRLAAWLAQPAGTKAFAAYDPDRHFAELEARARTPA